MTAQNSQPAEHVIRVERLLTRKIWISIEVLVVFILMLALRVALRSASIVRWEQRNLGWSYSLPFIWLGITALVMWLSRRGWSAYGVSPRNWRTNLDIGIKAYLVRFIPIVVGTAGAAWLGLTGLPGVVYRTIIMLLALALMIWVLNHQKEVQSGRSNIILTILLLFVPLGLALALGELNLVIVSTIIWQFIFSGFGEEFIYRGYIQSRLNQAFGRPAYLLGIRFGPGLIVASLLFGFLHAFNITEPGIGFVSLDWDWALSSALGGLFLGVIREKTDTLLAPGIAHGLPDAVGEPLIKLFGWESIF